MVDRSQGCYKKVPNNVVSQREHFNYLRNNSCGIWNAFTWGNNEAPIQEQNVNIRDYYQSQQNAQQQTSGYEDTRKNQAGSQNKGNRRVEFDEANLSRNQQNLLAQQSMIGNKAEKNTKKNIKARPASAANFQRKSRIAKDEEAQKIKNQQNKQKVQNYIQQLRPYSRGLSNTKFQDYFRKAAPQCYGRANTNQPIGGIIYGNHLKTFNINPHVYTNKPEYYQTHTTALNYGKRAKVCQDAKWKRLEKQLSKKLGLKQKNETLKQGKQVLYVDVDDNNKYQVMKQNHEFQKANKQQIHNKELQYKKDKHQQYLDDINQYYAKKKQRVADNLSTRQSIDITGSNLSPEQFQAKLNQQTIYRYHDKNGNIRLAGDRHAMTCFVDINFPENQAAYVEDLKSRMPIYAARVQGQDKFIDTIRKQNCKKGHEQVYPSHYLLRNCQQPEALKMLSNKTGVVVSGNKTQNQGKINSGSNTRKVGVNSPTDNIVNKSYASTANTQNIQGQRKVNLDHTVQYDDLNANIDKQDRYDNIRANKSEILDRAWGNRQVAGQVANNMNRNCCQTSHLPHNEMNPQCYRNASSNTGRIPPAG